MQDEFKKLRVFYERGVITKKEFKAQILGMFGYYDPADASVVRDLWELVPQSIRSEVALAIYEAAAPEFSWHPPVLGRSSSPDELRAESESIRAWANAFVRWFEEASGGGEPGQSP